MIIFLGAAWNTKLQIDIWCVANYEWKRVVTRAWGASGTPVSTVEFSPKLEFFF